MSEQRFTDRRTVLKGLGAGAVGSLALSGSVEAKGNNYGNGNGIGAFLNEKAMFKQSPVWDSGVADRTGQNEVDVLWGGMTDIDLPYPDTPDEGPWGVAPRAVEVSPGTEVTWTWYDGPDAINAHHLVSYFDPPYEEDFPNPFKGGGHDHPGGEDEFFVPGDLGDTYTHTFEEEGIYLYFCFPHGTPYTLNYPGLGEVENLFGQRGAVIVSGD